MEVYWYTVGPDEVNSQAVHFAEAVEAPHKDFCIDLTLVMLRVPELWQPGVEQVVGYTMQHLGTLVVLSAARVPAHHKDALGPLLMV